MLNQSLASEGYRVATAGSGEEAVTCLEEQEFDVIVTDLVMPGLGGLDVLEKARLLDPRAAVILMTAYASLDTAIAALRRGACDYLEKPFTVGDLKLRVRRLLQYRKHQGGRANHKESRAPQACPCRADRPGPRAPGQAAPTSTRPATTGWSRPRTSPAPTTSREMREPWTAAN